MKEIDSLNGSGIDENIPVFKIEVGWIEIIFPVNRSWMVEIKFSGKHLVSRCVYFVIARVSSLVEYKLD